MFNEIDRARIQFEFIWEKGRNKIFHGGFELTADNKREMHKLRDELVVAIVKGLKRLFEINYSAPPRSVSQYFPISDSFLRTEYMIPESKSSK